MAAAIELLRPEFEYVYNYRFIPKDGPVQPAKRAREAVDTFLSKVNAVLDVKNGSDQIVRQLYRAKAYRLGMKIIKEMDDPARCLEYHKQLKEICSALVKEHQHPGAMEMLAEIERDPVEQIKLRKRAALKGCRTSFVAIAFDNIEFGGKRRAEKYFDSWLELYLYASYELLLMAALGEEPDRLTDIGLPLYIAVLRPEPGFDLTLEDVAEKDMYKIIEMHSSAARFFTERYRWKLPGEVRLWEW